MASEIRASLSFQLTAGAINLTRSRSDTIDMSGSDIFYKVFQATTTASNINLPVAGWSYMTNIGMHRVRYGRNESGTIKDFAFLDPKDAHLFRINSDITEMRVITDAGPTLCEIMVLPD